MKKEGHTKALFKPKFYPKQHKHELRKTKGGGDRSRKEQKKERH